MNVRAARPLASTPWRKLRWLVLAPHPDDETLGAGALIAQAAREERFAGIVYLTDGAGSHDTGSTRLARARKREAAMALRRLTGRRLDRPAFLDWKDASPPAPGSACFEAARRTLVSLCRRRRIDALAVTGAHEPHCDHEAAADLAQAVRRTAKRPLLVAEYLVWAQDSADYAAALRTGPMLPGLRRHALRAHRSQLTASHGTGFRLPSGRLKMPACDLLYLRSRP